MLFVLTVFEVGVGCGWRHMVISLISILILSLLTSFYFKSLKCYLDPTFFSFLL